MSNKLAIKMLNEDYLNYIPQAAIITNDASKNINNLNISIKDDILYIKWQDPDSDHWEKSYVTKTENYIPADPRIENLLCQYSTKNQYFTIPLKDSNIYENKLYYFRIFTQFDNETGFYSGYKNIFAIYVYCPQTSTDPGSITPNPDPGDNPTNPGGTTEPTDSFIKSKIIEALNNINETTPSAASIDTICQKINNIQNNKRYMNFNMNLKLYNPPVKYDLTNIKHNGSIIDVPIYHLTDDKVHVYNDVSIYSNKLFSPTITNNIASQSLSPDELQNIYSVNNISMSILPPLDSMLQIMDNGSSDNFDNKFAQHAKLTTNDRNYSGYNSGEIQIAFNNYIICISTHDINIHDFKGGSLYYMSINTPNDGEYSSFNQHIYNAYFNIIGSSLYVYYEVINANNKDVYKVGLCMDSGLNMKVYMFENCTNVYDAFFSFSDTSTNIYNLKSNTMFTVSYSPFSVSTTSTISNGPFDLVPINQFIYYDNVINSYYRYDASIGKFGAIVTSNLTNDINKYGSQLTDINKVKVQFTDVALIYNTQYFNILNIDSNNIYGFIECNDSFPINGISSIAIDAENISNETMIFNVDGVIKTYDNGQWININKNDIITRGIPLNKLSAINFRDLSGKISPIIGYDNNSKLKFYNIVLLYDDINISTSLNDSNQQLQYILMGGIMNSLRSSLPLLYTVGLHKNDSNNILDTSLLILQNPAIFTYGYPYGIAGPQVSYPMLSISDGTFLHLQDFKYMQGGDMGMTNYNVSYSGDNHNISGGLQYNLSNITINEQYKYLSILSQQQFIQKTSTFDITSLGQFDGYQTFQNQLAIVDNKAVATAAEYDNNNYVDESDVLLVMDLSDNSKIMSIPFTNLISTFNFNNDILFPIVINQHLHLLHLYNVSDANAQCNILKVNEDYSTAVINTKPISIVKPLPQDGSDNVYFIQQVLVKNDNIYVLWRQNDPGIYCEPWYSCINISNETSTTIQQHLADFVKNAYLQVRDTWLMDGNDDIYIMQMCKDDYAPTISVYSCNQQKIINNWSNLEYTISPNRYNDFLLPPIASGYYANNSYYTVSQPYWNSQGNNSPAMLFKATVSTTTDSTINNDPVISNMSVNDNTLIGTNAQSPNLIIIQQIVPFQPLVQPYVLPDYSSKVMPLLMDLSINVSIDNAALPDLSTIKFSSMIPG